MKFFLVINCPVLISVQNETYPIILFFLSNYWRNLRVNARKHVLYCFTSLILSCRQTIPNLCHQDVLLFHCHIHRLAFLLRYLYSSIHFHPIISLFSIHLDPKIPIIRHPFWSNNIYIQHPFWSNNIFIQHSFWSNNIYIRASILIQ